MSSAPSYLPIHSVTRIDLQQCHDEERKTHSLVGMTNTKRDAEINAREIKKSELLMMNQTAVTRAQA
jgi:hypothetical protein